MIIGIILWTVLGIILLGYLQGSEAIDIAECSFSAKLFLIILGGPIAIFLFLFGVLLGLVQALVYILNGRR